MASHIMVLPSVILAQVRRGPLKSAACPVVIKLSVLGTWALSQAGAQDSWHSKLQMGGGSGGHSLGGDGASELSVGSSEGTGHEEPGGD